MSLGPGTRLGPYEILSAIGAGGMGEVYRATDTHLGRQVAIKVLPDAFAQDPERAARFEREARTLASLNHPNIAIVHGLEKSQGTYALVMELVEGEDLSQRIARGPIPLDEALPIARQTAEALEAAHEQGIIHRDLKPANIKVRPDGTVKVLDFGLAKAMEPVVSLGPNASLSPTITTPALMTGVGVLLGTAAYMAPEQARGKAVDRRADIWAFGCMLYEMVSGTQAFTGETVSDVLAAILTRDPDWGRLEAIPPAVRDLIARCVRKEPTRRLRDIGDARVALEELISNPLAAATSASATTPRPRSYTSAWIGALVVAAFALGLAGAWLRGPRSDASESFVGTVLGGPEVAMGPRVSPDGRLVAFQAMVDGQTQVAVMQPGSGDWNVLTHDRTRGIVSSLSWSPDGTRIYYGRVDGVPRGVFSVPAVGGDERLLVDDAACPEVLPDGSMLVVRLNERRERQLYRFWPETARLQGYPAEVFYIDLYRAVHAFRDGKEAVFWGRPIQRQDGDPNYYLSILNVDASTVRRVSSSLAPVSGQEFRPVASTPDDRAIVTVSRSGDLQTVVRIPRAGGPAHELASFSHSIWGLDVASNGDLYVDQMSRTLEVAATESDGTGVQRILTGNWEIPASTSPITMPDGRLLFSVTIGGRFRLLAVKPREKPSPFIQTNEETSGPVTMVGPADIAFVLGSGPARRVAIASAADGRIVRRLERLEGAAIQALAASPDGKTLYYAAGGKIWSIPSVDGSPTIVRDGDSVAVDPRGQYLIVQLNQNDDVRLVRVPLNGGQEHVLSFEGVRFSASLMPSNAIRADGAIVKSAAYSDSWAWATALLNPDTGKAQRIILPSLDTLDTQYVGWTTAGQIVAFTQRTNSTIWRLRPAPKQP
jgi:eukaryotic-like serine/threonine-protein kinase